MEQDRPAASSRHRTEEKREIELVDHERLARQAFQVAPREGVRKGGTLHRHGMWDLSSPDEMSPVRDVGTCDVSLGDVRALMVVVERLVIGAFEAHSCELPRLHVIPGARHHDLGRDVRGIGNVPARREGEPVAGQCWKQVGTLAKKPARMPALRRACGAARLRRVEISRVNSGNTLTRRLPGRRSLVRVVRDIR